MNTIYSHINAYIFDNGEVYKKNYLSSDLPADYSKYADEHGDIYFYRDYSLKKHPFVICPEDNWQRLALRDADKFSFRYGDITEEQEKAESLIPIVYPKTLGVLHFIITYVLLPLATLGFALIAFGNIYNSFVKGFDIRYITDILIDIAAAVSTGTACVALIKKSYIAKHMVKLHLLIYTLFCFASDVKTIMTPSDKYTIIPAGFIIFVIIALCVYRYYHHREMWLTTVDNTFHTASALVMVITRNLFIYIGLSIYIYSVVYMFKGSLIYGLIGLLLPGIGQTLFLFNTGFDTLYAYSCYCFLYAFLISFTSHSRTGKSQEEVAIDTEKQIQELFKYINYNKKYISLQYFSDIIVNYMANNISSQTSDKERYYVRDKMISYMREMRSKDIIIEPRPEKIPKEILDLEAQILYIDNFISELKKGRVIYDMLLDNNITDVYIQNEYNNSKLSLKDANAILKQWNTLRIFTSDYSINEQKQVKNALLKSLDTLYNHYDVGIRSREFDTTRMEDIDENILNDPSKNPLNESEKYISKIYPKKHK